MVSINSGTLYADSVQRAMKCYKEEDEMAKVKFLQDQTHTILKPETRDADTKNTKHKLRSTAAGKIVAKLSPKNVPRKKKRTVARFKVGSCDQTMLYRGDIFIVFFAFRFIRTN